MGKVDFVEALGWLQLAQPAYEAAKTAVDTLEAVPKDQRKPSHFIACATAILAAIGPLADKVEEDIKD